MNFAFLAEKYAGLKCIVHDRTWEGLQVLNGTKPSIEEFEAYQREEDRLSRTHDLPKAKQESLMRERQHQARHKAWEDIRPIEDKIKEEEDKIRQEIHSLKIAAKEIQERSKTVEALTECWHEISRAQEMINEEARAYLQDTDWYYTREKETNLKVPEEVVLKRQEARERIQAGQLVHANWQKLRAQAMPSRAEIQAAIKAGGEELARIAKICEDATSRYAKPKRKIY